MGHINPAGYSWVEDGDDEPERMPVTLNVPDGSLPAHTQAELEDGIARDGNGVEIVLDPHPEPEEAPAPKPRARRAAAHKETHEDKA